MNSKFILQNITFVVYVSLGLHRWSNWMHQWFPWNRCPSTTWTIVDLGWCFHRPILHRLRSRKQPSWFCHYQISQWILIVIYYLGYKYS